VSSSNPRGEPAHGPDAGERAGGESREGRSFNAALGLTAGADGEVVLDTRPEHQVAPGVIHFAVLATLGEVAAAAAVGAPVVPAAIALNLLTRAQPGRLVGRGRLLRKGRTLAVAEGDVMQDGKLVAKVSVTFAVLTSG
jgi:acyl-coenzyme A thioesterase PaaI-like protein